MVQRERERGEPRGQRGSNDNSCLGESQLVAVKACQVKNMTSEEKWKEEEKLFFSRLILIILTGL